MSMAAAWPHSCILQSILNLLVPSSPGGLYHFRGWHSVTGQKRRSFMAKISKK